MISARVNIATCVCFFGSGATDFEMLLTSLWTSVNIWFKVSTFSFFTALICEDTNSERLQQIIHQKNKCKNNRKRFVRVLELLWPAWSCSYASSACLRLERRSLFFSLFVCSLPCHLRREQQVEWEFLRYQHSVLFTCFLNSCIKW